MTISGPTITGPLDAADRRAGLKEIESENKERIQADPDAATLPSSTDAEIISSVETILSQMLTRNWNGRRTKYSKEAFDIESRLDLVEEIVKAEERGSNTTAIKNKVAELASK